MTKYSSTAAKIKTVYCKMGSATEETQHTNLLGGNTGKALCHVPNFRHPTKTFTFFSLNLFNNAVAGTSATRRVRL